MRTIRDFYRPAERSSNNRNNNRGSGGGKILAVLIIVALVGFAWAQPSVAGKMVGKANKRLLMWWGNGCLVIVRTLL